MTFTVGDMALVVNADEFLHPFPVGTEVRLVGRWGTVFRAYGLDSFGDFNTWLVHTSEIKKPHSEEQGD